MEPSFASSVVAEISSAVQDRHWNRLNTQLERLASTADAEEDLALMSLFLTRLAERLVTAAPSLTWARDLAARLPRMSLLEVLQYQDLSVWDKTRYYTGVDTFLGRLRLALCATWAARSGFPSDMSELMKVVFREGLGALRDIEWQWANPDAYAASWAARVCAKAAEGPCPRVVEEIPEDWDLVWASVTELLSPLVAWLAARQEPGGRKGRSASN